MRGKFSQTSTPESERQANRDKANIINSFLNVLTALIKRSRDKNDLYNL
jgi:hypothetical protein